MTKVEICEKNDNAVKGNHAKKLAGSFGRTVVYRHQGEEKSSMQDLQGQLTGHFGRVDPVGKAFLGADNKRNDHGFAPIDNLHTTVISMNVMDANSSAEWINNLQRTHLNALWFNTFL